MEGLPRSPQWPLDRGARAFSSLKSPRGPAAPGAEVADTLLMYAKDEETSLRELIEDEASGGLKA